MSLHLVKRCFVYFALAFTTLVFVSAAILQWYVFPNIDQFKPRITALATEAVRQPVTIENLSIRWQGIHPALVCKNITLFDATQRPALQLPQVKAVLSWSSLLLLSPTLSSLRIDDPDVIVRRASDGSLTLAGLSLAGESNPAFANWLISQRKIDIRNARVQWIDERRQAPLLALHDLNLQLITQPWQRLLGNHSLHIDTRVSTGTRQRIVIEAALVGKDVASLTHWQGDITLHLPETDLTVWQPWVTLPLPVQHGQGSLQATARFADAQLQSLSTQLDIRELVVTPPQHSESFEAHRIRGTVIWQRAGNGHALRLRDVHASVQPGLQMSQAEGDLTWQSGRSQGKLSIKTLQIDDSAALSAWLPEQTQGLDVIQNMHLRGVAKSVKFDWNYQQGAWKNYHAAAVLERVHTQTYQRFPGLENWQGTLKLSPEQGEFHVDTENASIDTAGLLRWPIPIHHLRGKVKWETNAEKTLIFTRDLQFDNAHLALRLNAEYQLGAVAGDHLRLQSQIMRGDAQFAPFYYPTILGESTLHWLDTSILAGNIAQGEVVVRGRLADFPFVNAAHQPDPKLGVFRVTAEVDHAKLEYGTGWPLVNNVKSQLRFHGKRMDIDVRSGETMGNQIVQAHAEIPQLDADNPVLNITSAAKGTLDKGISFVNNSPVKQLTEGFTDHLKASGDGELQLNLQIPLENVDAAKFQGDYLIKNGHLDADDALGLPDLSKINGHLKFTEKGLSAQNIPLELFDNPAMLNSLTTRADKSVLIQGSGHITDAALRKLDNNLLTNALRGSTDWKANIFILKPRFQIDIRSALNGMATTLPPPFNKSAESTANLLISLKQESKQSDNIDIQYDNWISAKLLREHSNRGTQISGGDIAINTTPRKPTNDGLTIHAELAKLNIDDWLDYLKVPSGNGPDKQPSAAVSSVEINTDALQVFNRTLHQMKLQLTPGADKLDLAIQSQELAGTAEWLQGSQNRLIAKLNYLRIPRSQSPEVSTPAADIRKQTSAYPALEINAQAFQFGDKALGSLDLKAYNSGDNWIIQRMAIANTDSQLIADGVWRNTVRSPNTQLKFNLISNQLGKTLQRFTPGDLIKGGNATMSGQIGWPGSPHEFAIEHLDGQFNLLLEKGQISKVQPGVGRLLGLLSLQSLPRRLTLDFRDLFSEGFAFDKIQCTANINDGVLRSQDLYMTGPAAEANIQGETNLKTETQLLKIKVMPHISDSLSLAALAGGPIAGVAAFVAQKLLKDPLNKISSSEYLIGGTWDNPQEQDIDKVTPTGNPMPAK